MRVNWNAGRRGDGSIDLIAALSDLLTKIEPGVIITPVDMENVKRYLHNVQTIQRITSQQVAALALANALQLVRASWQIVESKGALPSQVETGQQGGTVPTVPGPPIPATGRP